MWKLVSPNGLPVGPQVPSSGIALMPGPISTIAEFQAALTGGKYNFVTCRVSIVKNSARYETGSLYHRALR
jgi:hypothetical protein